MDFYTGKIELAQRLIKKRGKPMTWVQVRNSQPNPQEPWNPGPAIETPYPGTMIALLPTDRYTFETFRFQKNSEIQIGYEMAYMAQQTFVPNIKDKILDGVNTLTVEDMAVVHPDGRDILYILLLSK